MNSEELKNIQAPLKEKYRQDASSALKTLQASSVLGEGISCKIDTGARMVEAGLHPATGGTGMLACSGDMLLEALAACAGVTFCAVATALSFSYSKGQIAVEGDVDFRGTLGVDRTASVGFEAIRLQFQIATEEPRERLEKVLELTERYCVVLQTLTKGITVATDFTINPPT